MTRRCMFPLSFVLVAAGTVWLSPVLSAAQEAIPPSPVWFTYDVSRTVGSGTGGYVGYTDSLTAAGRYDITSTPTDITIVATYDWIYRGERCEDGQERRNVGVGLPGRLYNGRTDLDDYDSAVAASLATWVWIPPGSLVGSPVQVLERAFTVEGLETIAVAGSQASALRLRATGSGFRNDDYGQFQTNYTDTYWFDATTGYFLRSEYVENNNGTSGGSPAGFVWTERVEVSGASYLPGAATPVSRSVGRCRAASSPGWETRRSRGRDAGTVLCLSVAILVTVFVIVMLMAWGHRRSRRRTLVDGRVVEVRQADRPDDVPEPAQGDSPFFAPFVRYFAQCAMRAGDPVFVARLGDGTPVGVGLTDREAMIGSIFAKDGDVCEQLRRALDVSEFFTETRHETIPTVVAAAGAAVQQPPKAYNVFETYEVLELSSPQQVSYDSSLVTRMTEADLPEVAALSATVYGVRGERWLAAALAAGDMGFSARVDGKLVGYALATVLGDRARFHTNTVDPAFRGRGIGKELARARLCACAALGATRVVTEVATWNVASLEVVRPLGFVPIGQMWVESAASTRVERTLVRR